MPSLAKPLGEMSAPGKETGAKDLPQAPYYTIPPRRFGAVEHPMIIKDIDKGIKTFGRGHSFQTILDSASPQISVPLYFRPDNPTVRPLTSHNAASHNVIVKVTLPKRTGRKRRRGTDAPFEYHDAPPVKKVSVEAETSREKAVQGSSGHEEVSTAKADDVPPANENRGEQSLEDKGQGTAAQGATTHEAATQEAPGNANPGNVDAINNLGQVHPVPEISQDIAVQQNRTEENTAPATSDNVAAAETTTQENTNQDLTTQRSQPQEPTINPTDRRPPPTIPPGAETILSHSHLDTPSLLRRKLRDTVGKYTLEPVGVVHNTHRYRGLSDFQYSMGNSRFMNRFVAQVMPGSIPKLRQYEIEVGTAQAPDIDLVPPPFFAPQGMPNSYNYSQNPFVRNLGADGLGEETRPLSSVSGDSDDESQSEAESKFSEEFERVVNTSMRGPAPGYFIRYNEFPSPARPRVPPDLSDPHVAAVMAELRRAMNERPVWTRRSMFNRLSSAVSSLPKSGNIIKHCIQYAGYQFRGGPWRDSLVKYGVDPRSDPKYRIYQTLIFKLHKRRVGNVGGTWQSVRRKEVSTLSGSFGRYWKDSVEAATDNNNNNNSNPNSAGEGEGRGRENTPAAGGPSRVGHEFDGTSFSTDGKVWQVCDISDPLLSRLFSEATPLPECDFEKSGWYPPVLWFVAKAIMKRKMLAIRFKRHLPDSAFEPALKIVRDAAASGRDASVVENINVPLPDLGLTTEEREQIRGRKMKGGRKGGGERRREKNKNATLRIRQKATGAGGAGGTGGGGQQKAEVRFVEYPDNGRYQVVGRRMEDAPNSGGRGPSMAVVGDGPAGGGDGEGEKEKEKEKAVVEAEVVEKEENLRDLIESDEDDQEEEEDDEDDDDEDSEEEEDGLEDDDPDDEIDDYDLEGEELDEEAIQWRL